MPSPPPWGGQHGDCSSRYTPRRFSHRTRAEPAFVACLLVGPRMHCHEQACDQPHSVANKRPAMNGSERCRYYRVMDVLQALAAYGERPYWLLCRQLAGQAGRHSAPI